MKKIFRRLLEIIGLRESEKKIVKRRMIELAGSWNGKATR